jgi:hypothetical protein
MTSAMTRAELTEKLLGIKRENGRSYPRYRPAPPLNVMVASGFGHPLNGQLRHQHAILL